MAWALSRLEARPYSGGDTVFNSSQSSGDATYTFSLKTRVTLASDFSFVDAQVLAQSDVVIVCHRNGSTLRCPLSQCSSSQIPKSTTRGPGSGLYTMVCLHPVCFSLFSSRKMLWLLPRVETLLDQLPAIRSVGIPFCIPFVSMCSRFLLLPRASTERIVQRLG